MIEYIFWTYIPLRPTGSSGTDAFITIAKYSFDPGVNVGDLIRVDNMKWGTHSDKPISFSAMVTKIQKVIIPQQPIDKMQVNIYLELDDKEEISRIKEIMQRLNPGSFEEIEVSDDPSNT